MRKPLRADATAATPDPEQKGLPLREAATEVLATTRRHLAELLELFTLEIRYSGLMLGSAVALAMVAALAAFSLWGLLLAATAAWLLGSGWSWATTLAVLALANGVLVLSSLWLMRRSLKGVGIDSTRQALGLGVSNVSE